VVAAARSFEHVMMLQRLFAARGVDCSAPLDPAAGQPACHGRANVGRVAVDDD
jgi:hypothetical protein